MRLPEVNVSFHKFDEEFFEFLYAQLLNYFIPNGTNFGFKKKFEF